jgi:predicted nucleic acid-binding Zn ribbon protein
VPRYDYRCDTCGVIDTIMHDRNEDLSGCECVTNLQANSIDHACHGHMKKLMNSRPFKFVNPGDKTQVIHHES